MGSDAGRARRDTSCPTIDDRAPGEPGSYTITASRDGNHSINVTVVADSGQSTESSSDGSVAQAEGEKERIFDNGNGLGGNPGGKIPKFTIDALK
ncbi:MAG: hypothetical protein WC911_08005 [Thermoleophilia bacterium]